MRSPALSQCVIIAVCTALNMSRSNRPSRVHAVTRSGTTTIVTSSAMTRPLMPVRSVSDPSKSPPDTWIGATVPASSG